MATYQQRRNDQREKPAFASVASKAMPMTAEEIQTAIRIMSGFRCLEVGRTAMRLFEAHSSLDHYSVMLIDDQSFDLFGKDLKTRCFEGTMSNGLTFKSYADRRIVAYKYDPEIWDGRMIIPTGAQIQKWFEKNPLLKTRHIDVSLKTVLRVAELNELPWFDLEYKSLFYSLLYFDHTYGYSDDIKAWRHGNERHSQLSDKVHEMEHGLELAALVSEFTVLPAKQR